MERRAVAAIVAMLVASAAGGSGEPDAEGAARGLSLAAQGRCEEALAALSRAGAADPADRGARLAEAQCRMRLRDYRQARELLLALRAGTGPGEDDADVDLYLGIATYHAGDLAGAREALERARRADPERAEAHLYLGVVSFEEGDHASALHALERARAIDAERVDPMASYYAGIARARRGEREASRGELERVLATDPNGPWAEKAQRALERLARRRDPALPWRLELTAGIESDDNVLLRGEDETLPEEISDQRDERLAWRVKGNYRLAGVGGGHLGVSGDYLGTEHRDIEGFDVHYPAAALWWQRPLGRRSAARVEYKVGLAWVEGNSYFTQHAAGPAVVHRWRDAGRTTARLRALYYDYRHAPADIPDGAGVPGDPCPATTPAGRTCGTPGLDESRRRDRTGIGYELVARHEWRLPGVAWEIALQPGLRIAQHFARGDEASYLRLEPGLAVEWELPFAFRATTEASFAYRPYAGRTSLPEPGTATAGVQFQAANRKRRDRITRAGVSLERSLLDGLVAEVRYAFTDNDSNLRLSQYRRHIIGGYLTVQLGRDGFFGGTPAEEGR